jgi:uncharacterized membrane protein YfcA
MTIPAALLVALAGAACGLVNSVAGGGSLILFPTLLLVGLPPLTANVTNSVAAWPGYLGGVTAFRRELSGRRTMLTWLVGVTIVGATAGCILLLVTPTGAFDVVVPVLVLIATVMTALQPVVRRRLHPTPTATDHRPGWAALAAIFVATVYGGYFGGALGVIVLAVLGLTFNDTMRNLTASKTIVTLANSTVSVLIFGLFGPVRWEYVAVAAPTALAGGYVGGAIARRLDERMLRLLVVSLGAVVTVILIVRAL